MISSSPSFKTALMRGLMLLCPRCGQGRLLKGYIAQRESCSHCHEQTGQIRADDGPAWLTILLVGHILAPLILTLEEHQTMALVPELILIMSLAIVLIGYLLPRAKGIFIAAIWASRQSGPS